MGKISLIREVLAPQRNLPLAIVAGPANTGVEQVLLVYYRASKQIVGNLFIDVAELEMEIQRTAADRQVIVCHYVIGGLRGLTQGTRYIDRASESYDNKVIDLGIEQRQVAGKLEAISRKPGKLGFEAVNVRGTNVGRYKGTKFRACNGTKTYDLKILVVHVKAGDIEPQAAIEEIAFHADFKIGHGFLIHRVTRH